MIEIRIHRRGGQGGVTLAKIMAAAQHREGLSVQAFSHAFDPQSRLHQSHSKNRCRPVARIQGSASNWVICLKE